MPPMQARERFVSANGLIHHVVEWGDERAQQVIVLCHGFLDLAWGFSQLAEALSDAGVRALAVDFRGHGESGRIVPGGYYYFPDYLLDLHEVLPQLLDGPFHLLGHSMGGTVCTMYAATHGERIRTLSLLEGLGPSGDDPARAPERLTRWLEGVGNVRRGEGQAALASVEEAFTRLSARHRDAPAPFLRMLAEKATCPHPRGEGRTWRFDPLHRTLSPIAFEPERFKHFVRRIAAPTLVVDGERGLRNESQAERRALLSDARHRVIEGAGHMLHWTHCARVSELLLEHIGARAT